MLAIVIFKELYAFINWAKKRCLIDIELITIDESQIVADHLEHSFFWLHIAGDMAHVQISTP